MPIRRLLFGAWLVVVLLLAGEPAAACWNNHRHETRVLGVTPTGSLLVQHDGENEASDALDESF